MEKTGKDFLKVGEAAKFLGIPTHTLRRLEESGELPPTHRTENGTRLYSLKALEFYRDAQAKGITTDMSELERRLRNTVIFQASRIGWKRKSELHRNCQSIIHYSTDPRLEQMIITDEDIEIFCEHFSILPPERP